MKVEKDFEELLEFFNKRKVKYCIVGAFAVGFYGRPRYTKDMDILIKPDIKNGEKIMGALREFGFGNLALSPGDFALKGKFIQLGYEPVRVDIITSLEGVTFDKIWKNREIGVYGRQKVYFIGLNELIKTKKAANRAQDKADLDILTLAKKKH